MTMRVQFILRYRDNTYTDDCYSYTYLSSGLFNSARLVQEMLRDVVGLETRIDQAENNNHIDRLVTEYKPDVVVIEAYWVTPEKFDVLTKRHPSVTWIVRNHSAMPFVAMESRLIDWSIRYMDRPRVILACNDARADADFRRLIALYKPEWSEAELARRCVLLPNYYPWEDFHLRPPHHHEQLNIGCFGAVRPLKNHLQQAVAAIRFAEESHRPLSFHINATRIEGKGEPILENLIQLFDKVPNARLVEHGWLNRHHFLRLVREMDLGMQVSYSETFNIVAADMITNGVPVVGSSEIPWLARGLMADPNSSDDIRRVLWDAKNEFHHRPLVHESLRNLRHFDRESIARWTGCLERLPLRPDRRPRHA